MTVSTLIQRINYALRGTDDDAPTEGTEEADYWLSVVNQKKDEWARDPNESWRSLFEVRDAADPTVTAGVQIYDLDDDFIRPADSVYVMVGSDRHDFNLVSPELRDETPLAVYIVQTNPQTLVFNDSISATDSIVGGTIYVPGYFLPADMTEFTDDVPVDDPNWLSMACASEIAFNDVSYEDKAADINAKANALYTQMKTTNKRGTPTNLRKVPTNVTRIRGF